MDDERPDVPPEWRLVMSFGGLPLAAGSANVVMQLSRLPVGHGVANSPVESGRVDLHPIKRLRTTLGYLYIAMRGTDGERRRLRHQINDVHRLITAEAPVAYKALDPDLQLWVAACLYRGSEDLYRIIRRAPLEGEALGRFYRYGARLGTTLQVRAGQWPEDREAFEAYWQAGLARMEMDDTTRGYLRDFLTMRRQSLPMRLVFGRLNVFLATGFLTPEFREELGLSWSDGRERLFRALIRVHVALARLLPRPLRAVPFNLVGWDTRRRLRAGRPVV